MLDFSQVVRYWNLFLMGAGFTVLMSVIAIVASFAIALVGVALRVSPSRVFSLPASGYVHLLRNTPLLVLMYILFFGVGSLGLNLDGFQAGILALTLNSTAYTIEIYRGGVAAVGRGQIDAANSLGFNALQRWRYVVLPQAMRTVFHPLGNQVVQVVQGSAVAVAIAAPELTSQTYSVGGITYSYFESFLIAGILYFILVQIISLGWHLIGTRALPTYTR